MSRKVLIQIYEEDLRHMIHEECKAVAKEVIAHFTKDDDEGYMGTAEAATFLGISKKTVREWILSGKLPASKAGKKYRIRRDHVRKLLHVEINSGIKNPLKIFNS